MYEEILNPHQWQITRVEPNHNIPQRGFATGKDKADHMRREELISPNTRHGPKRNHIGEISPDKLVHVQNDMIFEVSTIIPLVE